MILLNINTQKDQSMHLLRYSALLLFLIPCSFGAPLSIQTAVDQFINHNYDIKIAQQELDKSKADLTTAKQRPNPTLSASYSYLDVGHHFRDMSSATPAFATIHLDHPIELGGKRTRRIEVANEGISYAKDQFEETKREVLFNLIGTYYQIQADEIDLRDSIADRKDFTKVLEIAQEKFKHGFLSQIDLDKLQLQLIDYDNDINTNQAALLADKESLAFLLSIDVKDLELLPLASPEAFLKSADELISYAQQHRSDCIAAEQNIKLSKASVALEKANAVPDVTVGVEVENYAPLYSNPLLGLSASIPLPIYDRNEGTIEKARVTALQANTQKMKTLNQAASEVRLAMTQYQSQQFIYTTMQRGFDSAKALKEKAEKIFSLKGISILELLDAQKSYRDYQTNKTKAMINLNIALANLKLYSGLAITDSKGY